MKKKFHQCESLKKIFLHFSGRKDYAFKLETMQTLPLDPIGGRVKVSNFLPNRVSKKVFTFFQRIYEKFYFLYLVEKKRLVY